MNEQIRAMKALGFTDEEIKDVVECDKRIDRGEKLFELSEDQKKTEKKMRQADRAVNAYGKKVQRERKADDDKRFLIDTFVWALTTDIEHSGDNVYAENVNIINPEREVEFTYNGKKYKIVLSAPRK
jgi:DNA-binding transcriptional MerR regulator